LELKRRLPKKQLLPHTEDKKPPRGRAYQLLCDLRWRGVRVYIDEAEQLRAKPDYLVTDADRDLLKIYDDEVRRTLPLMLSKEARDLLLREWADQERQWQRLENLEQPTTDGETDPKGMDPQSAEFTAAARQAFQPIVDVPATPQADYRRSWPWRPARVDYIRTEAGWVSKKGGNRNG
jgi:hypothetical protein